MTSEKTYATPDSMDIEASLQDALAGLHPVSRLPNQELFGLDGLGMEPQPQYPLNGYVGDVDSASSDDYS